MPCADICPFVLVGFACELMARLIEEYASAFLGYIFVTRMGVVVNFRGLELRSSRADAILAQTIGRAINIILSAQPTLRERAIIYIISCG